MFEYIAAFVAIIVYMLLTLAPTCTVEYMSEKIGRSQIYQVFRRKKIRTRTGEWHLYSYTFFEKECAANEFIQKQPRRCPLFISERNGTLYALFEFPPPTI